MSEIGLANAEPCASLFHQQCLYPLPFYSMNKSKVRNRRERKRELSNFQKGNVWES